MPISKFKAQCLSVMDRVRRTGRPVRVTRYGRPIADVVPPSLTPGLQRTLGVMADRTIVTGEIVSPLLEPADWDALR
jgi:prevent-host-death family protein